MGNISANFNYEDFFKESKRVREMACYHIPDLYRRIKTKLVDPILQPLRDFLKSAVVVSSGYRSDAYNAGLKNSSPNSHHLFRADKAAADIRTEDMPKAWTWLMNHRENFCYSYWNKNDNFIHISALTELDKRIGRMWRIEADGKNHYEPNYDPDNNGRNVA